MGAGAQSQDAMRLNEFLVVNTDDFQDDFGQQSAWFALFNSSYGTVDIGGCYLSDDPANLKKYIIPGGDILTKIKPRQHVIFWADNQPFRGTFHVSFNLADADEIIFTKGDGKTVIDRIKVRKDLPDNVSYGRVMDGEGSITGDGEGWDVMKQTSPSTNNSLVDKGAKPQRMKEMDPYGWIMAVLCMSVVFMALIILYFIFKSIGKANIRLADKKSRPHASDQAEGSGTFAETPAETYAAIAAALHLYSEENAAHDEESFVVTQNHTDRSYSPWSSKIYSLRQAPQVKKNK